MIETQLTPVDPISQAKMKWEAISPTRRRHKLTFEQLLQRFESGEAHSVIASDDGVTRVAIHRIYNKYFRDLLGGMSGTELMAVRKERRFLQSEKDFLDHRPFVKKMVEKIRSAGCTVELVPSHNRGRKILSSYIKVNGHLCSLRKVTNRIHRENRTYGRLNVWASVLCRAMYLILYCDEQGFDDTTFVLPTWLVVKHCPGAIQCGGVSLYIPTTQSSRQQSSRMNYWGYVDAWPVTQK